MDELIAHTHKRQERCKCPGLFMRSCRMSGQLGRSSLSLNRLLWLLMTECRGWLALSIICSSLSSVLISATVTRESSFIPTTEPARLISLSSLDVSFLYMLLPPANHSVKEETVNLRLVKHQQQFAADVERLQSP